MTTTTDTRFAAGAHAPRLQRSRELEIALEQHPDVMSALVLSRAAQWVAFVVPAHSHWPDANELFAKLPVNESIQTHSCSLAYLDRFDTDVALRNPAMLPWPDTTRDDFGQVSFVEPRNALEREVASIWADVLGETAIGRFDNMRSVDGYSLLAIQVCARFKATFGVDLSAKDVHESRAVWELAATVAQAMACVRGEASSETHAAVERHRGATFDLTAYQRSVWNGELVSDEAGVYNIALAWRIHGAIDRLALAGSIEAVACRNEALRTLITYVGEVPMQYVPAAMPLAWREVDFASEDGADDSDRIDKAMRDEAIGAFDLAREAPLRACLLRLGATEHVLLLTVHHIASDGWSSGLIVRQIAEEYSSRRNGRPLSLASASRQYEDFAAWCVGQTAPGAQSESLAFWRDQLRAPLQRLEWPFDLPAEGPPAVRGDSLSFTWGIELEESLRALARRLDCTLFAMFAAALQLMLARYSGQCDVRIGYPVANRGEGAFHNVVGCFVSTLVLRTEIEFGESARTLIKQVARSLRAAEPHQHVPFERLIDEARGRAESPVPLVQVMLNLNFNDMPALMLEGTRTDALPRVSVGTPFELTWIVSRVKGSLDGRVEFDAKRFDRATVERMVGHFETLLRAIADEPERPVARLAWMPERERQSILQFAKGVDAAPVPLFAPVHVQFERRCRETPSAMALSVDDATFDYASLNARANQLAHLLRRHGVAAEVPVAVCVERGAAMVISLLAVMKAGGVYVPLDIDQPPGRLESLLRDCGAALIVATDASYPSLPQWRAGEVLSLDALRDELQMQPNVDLVDTGSPTQLAYVLYTSGSTGSPKGVMVSRQSLSSHVHACIDRYDVGNADRMLQFSATSFDTSIEQILVPLAAGASLVARGVAPWSHDELAKVIAANDITVADIPTAYWHLFATMIDDPLSRTSLRLLLIGGEAASAVAGDAHRRRFATLNAYGPTEATVTACVGEVAPGRPGLGPFVPVGKPLGQTKLYILDDTLALMPRGVIGEIHISGDRIARGYLGRPALTAERFVPDPYGEPGWRMYRTGDLGRMLDNGDVEFIGRADDQVKIRGTRIELGEVEAALRRHPAVRDVAVVVCGAEPLDKHLAAHVVLESPLHSNAVRRHAREVLAQSMIPTSWYFPPTLPLTAHGKVDRKSLGRIAAPAPEPIPGLSDEAAPSDAIEVGATLEKVLATAQAIAPGPPPGPDADLFECGFHSLLLVRLSAQLHADFDVRIAMRDMVRLRTLRAIAARIASSRDRDAQIAVPH